MRKSLLWLFFAVLMTVGLAFGAADDISRLYTFSPGQTIQSAQINGEFNQLVNTMNGKFGRSIANTISGNNTFSGSNIFSGSTTFSHATSPILTDIISERSAGNGVAVDSVVLKDGFIRVPAGAGYTPATNGDFGYDSTSNTYDVYVNGAAKSVLHTGSSIDDLNDVSLSSLTSGQGLVYNGTAWANASIGSAILLETKTASSSASLTFTSGIDSTYKSYEIRCSDLKPATDVVNLHLRVSEDAGSNWKSGAANYSYATLGYTDTASAQNFASSGDTAMVLTANASVGSDTNEALYAHIMLYNPSASSTHKRFSWDLVYDGSSGQAVTAQGGGKYKGTTNAINGLQLFFSSGNITSGFCSLYGVK